MDEIICGFGKVYDEDDQLEYYLTGVDVNTSQPWKKLKLKDEMEEISRRRIYLINDMGFLDSSRIVCSIEFSHVQEYRTSLCLVELNRIQDDCVYFSEMMKFRKALYGLNWVKSGLLVLSLTDRAEVLKIDYGVEESELGERTRGTGSQLASLKSEGFQRTTEVDVVKNRLYSCSGFEIKLYDLKKEKLIDRIPPIQNSKGVRKVEFVDMQLKEDFNTFVTIDTPSRSISSYDTRMKSSLGPYHRYVTDSYLVKIKYDPRKNIVLGLGYGGIEVFDHRYLPSSQERVQKHPILHTVSKKNHILVDDMVVLHQNRHKPFPQICFNPSFDNGLYFSSWTVRQMEKVLGDFYFDCFGSYAEKSHGKDQILSRHKLQEAEERERLMFILSSKGNGGTRITFKINFFTSGVEIVALILFLS